MSEDIIEVAIDVIRANKPWKFVEMADEIATENNERRLKEMGF